MNNGKNTGQGTDGNWAFNPAALTPAYQNPTADTKENSIQPNGEIKAGFIQSATDEKAEFEKIRKSLIKKVLRFASALCQYGEKVKNRRLIRDINCSEAYLEKLRGTDLAIKGRTILAFTRKYLKELHFFYIADEDILEFEQEMKRYTKVLEGSRIYH